MRKQQVEKWKERNDEKERTREKERGEGREGGGRILGKEHWAAKESRREERRRKRGGEGDYRRGIAAQEGEEINKGAKIERGEGMLGLGACLEALQLLSIRMRRLRIEVASCSVRTGLPLFVWEYPLGQPVVTMKLADNEKDTGIIRYDRSNTFSNSTTKIIRRWLQADIFFFFFVHKFQYYIFVGIKDKE